MKILRTASPWANFTGSYIKKGVHENPRIKISIMSEEGNSVTATYLLN